MSVPFRRFWHGAALAVVPLVLTVAGCGDSEYRLDPDTRGPTITLIDSTALLIPTDFGVDPELVPSRIGQGYLITDRFQFRTYRFDSTGKAIGTFPVRPSPDPGVEASPAIVLAGDSLIAVHDWRDEVLRVFHLESGARRYQVRAPFRMGHAGWAANGSEILIGTGFIGTSIARWPGTQEDPVLVGSMPRRLLESPRVYFRYGGTGITTIDSSLVLALPTEPGIRILMLDGALVDGIVVPAVRRKGTPAGLLEREKPIKQERRFHTTGSTIGGLHRRADGGLLIHYLDWDQVGHDSLAVRPVGPLWGNYHSYLTLLSPDRTQLCIDGHIPAPSDHRHSMMTRGDTLELFARRDTIPGHVRVTIYRYLVSTEGCDWVDAPRWQPD